MNTDELRPSQRQTWKHLGLLTLACIATLVLTEFTRSRIDISVRVGIITPLFILGAIAVALHGLVSRITLTPTGLVWKTWIGRERQLFAADLAEAATFTHVAPRGRPTERLVLRRRDGGQGAVITAGAWQRNDFLRVLAHLQRLGVPTTDRVGILSTAEAAERFPGTLPYWERHGMLLGALIAVVIIAVVAVGVWFFGGYADR